MLQTATLNTRPESGIQIGLKTPICGAPQSWSNKFDQQLDWVISSWTKPWNITLRVGSTPLQSARILSLALQQSIIVGPTMNGVPVISSSIASGRRSDGVVTIAQWRRHEVQSPLLTVQFAVDCILLKSPCLKLPSWSSFDRESISALGDAASRLPQPSVSQSPSFSLTV